MNRPTSTSPDRLSNAGQRVSQAFHRIAWRLIDAFLRVESGQVLNHRPSASPPADVGQQLHRTAKKLKAEATRLEGRRVDYATVSASETYAVLRTLTAYLQMCSLEDLGKGAERLAFWINLYNALVIDGIIHFQIGEQIGVRLFRRAAYDVCGLRFSLDDIEHGVLRGNRPHPLFKIAPFGPGDQRLQAVLDHFDARIHFALVCGAKSCPPIAVYEGNQLNQQLDRAAASFINGGWVQHDPETQVLRISPIFKWYERDFGGLQQVRTVIARYSHDPAVQQAARDDHTGIRYQDYDWSVNALL